MEVSYSTMIAAGNLVKRLAQNARRLEKALAETMNTSAEWKRIADELKAERNAAKQEAVSARQDAVKRAEADRVVIEGLRCEIDRLKTTCSANGADWEHASKACGITDDEYPLKAVLRVVAERNALAATLAEHRASFGARTESDAKIIEGLRAEVQDQRAEIERLGEKIDELPMQTTVMAVARREGEERAAEVLQSRVQDMREEIIRVNEAHGKTKVERDGLLDELAAQREAFTAEVGRIRRELCEERNALRAEVADLRGTFSMRRAKGAAMSLTPENEERR